MQPFLMAKLSEVGNPLLQAGKGTEWLLAPLSMCKRLNQAKAIRFAAELTGGQGQDWPHSHVELSFAVHSPVHPPLVLTPRAALSPSLSLQGAPGRMGAQGDPGLKGYQVRPLFSSPSFYLFLKLPLQDVNCSSTIL